MEEIKNNQSNLSYSKTIPDRDINDRTRLTKKYWWLDTSQEIIKKLATRFKGNNKNNTPENSTI